MDLCRRSAAREALRSNRASGNPPKCSNFFFPFTLVPDPPAPFIGSSECLRCASLRLQLSWISLGEIGKDSSWNWCMGNRYGTLYFFKIPSNGIPSLVFRFPLNGRDICFPSNEIFPPFFFFLLFFVFFSFCSYIYIYIYIYIGSLRLERSKLVEFWICRSCWVTRRRGIQRFITVQFGDLQQRGDWLVSTSEE